MLIGSHAWCLIWIALSTYGQAIGITRGSMLIMTSIQWQHSSDLAMEARPDRQVGGVAVLL